MLRVCVISKWFPKVDSEEVARDLAKQGACAAIRAFGHERMNLRSEHALDHEREGEQYE